MPPFGFMFFFFASPGYFSMFLQCHKVLDTKQREARSLCAAVCLLCFSSPRFRVGIIQGLGSCSAYLTQQTASKMLFVKLGLRPASSSSASRLQGNTRHLKHAICLRPVRRNKRRSRVRAYGRPLAARAMSSQLNGFPQEVSHKSTRVRSAAGRDARRRAPGLISP